jgi:hypothetical protein
MWKPVQEVFKGGTAELKSFSGKRVRTRVLFSGCPTYDTTKPGNRGTPVTLRVGLEGLVGLVPEGNPDMVVLAFPRSGVRPPQSLQQLARMPFDSILVNWVTFRRQFDIDI